MADLETYAYDDARGSRGPLLAPYDINHGAHLHARIPPLARRSEAAIRRMLRAYRRAGDASGVEMASSCLKRGLSASRMPQEAWR